MDRIKKKEYVTHMRIKPIEFQPKNKFIQAYRAKSEPVMNFFDYKPFEDLSARVQDVQHKTYKRQALSETLLEMNKNWDAPEQTLHQIERLKEKNSVVVIGGQQAGLLTGPMYTINKIISVIRLAKEQESKLKIPVIPVFWIAGEDHDYDEINHIHTLRNSKVYKHKTKQQPIFKKSISHLKMDQEKTLAWVKEAFQDLPETTYTKDLFDTACTILAQSETMVDFFAKLIFALFQEEGIVLIDSGHDQVRRLESEFFIQMIEKQKDVAHEIYETVQRLEQKGYTVPLEVEKDDANLFYHDDHNERILLKRLEDIWVGKNDEIELTTRQLLEIATHYPERLSNNVVTRPIMQEFLFPTLAFVAGDGEISYWAALKKAFHLFNLHMPPVIPRLSFTFVSDRIEKIMETRVVSVEDVIHQGTSQLKMNWLASQQSPPVEQLFEAAKQGMDQIHAPLRELAHTIGTDLSSIAEKNMQYITDHLLYLEQRTIGRLKEINEVQLQQFDEIEQALRPNQVLQERVWSPLPFVNQYGIDFIQELIQIPDVSVKNPHYIIYFI